MVGYAWRGACVTHNPRWTNATKWPQVSLTRQPWTPPFGTTPAPHGARLHSTVTLFARFLGLSTSVPLAQAV